MAAGLAIVAALAAASPAAPAPSDTVDAVEVTTRAPVVGDLQKGVVNYRPEFFTAVRPGTALDMITWLPGFTFEDTRDARGLEGSTGNVLIDGKPPTSKTDTLQSVLRRIPASQVERVDIIVGGAPGINMHGRNVIANVILKAGATKRRVLNVQTYVDGHGRVSPNGTSISTSEKHGDRTLDASLETGRSVVIYPGFGYGSWVRRDETGAAQFTTDTRASIGGPYLWGAGAYEFPFAAGKLRVNTTLRWSGTYYETLDSLRPGPGAYGFHEDNTYRQGELGLRYERTLGRLTLEAQALDRPTHQTVDDITHRPPVPNTFSIDAHLNEAIARVVARFKRDDKLTLEASAEGTLNTLHNVNVVTLDGAPEVTPGADVHIREHRGETGVTLAWKPNPRFSLDAALKVEASDLTATGDVNLVRRFAYPKPRLAVAWSIDKSTQLRLRGEREVGQIAFVNFVTLFESNLGEVRAGNPAIRPQRAWTAEAVLERDFWSGGALVLTARAKALQDVVDVAPLVTPTGVFGGVANIGDGRETDLIASLTLPLKTLGWKDAMLKGSVTRLRTSVADPLDGVRRPFSSVAGLLGELHFAQDFPQWKFNWGIDAFYRGPVTLYRPLGNETLAAWPHVNVFVEYRPKPALNLRLEVQNLPGTHVRQTDAVYAGLRNASALTYLDERRLSVGPVVFLRVRRNFE